MIFNLRCEEQEYLSLSLLPQDSHAPRNVSGYLQVLAEEGTVDVHHDVGLLQTGDLYRRVSLLIWVYSQLVMVRPWPLGEELLDGGDLVATSHYGEGSLEFLKALELEGVAGQAWLREMHLEKTHDGLIVADSQASCTRRLPLKSFLGLETLDDLSLHLAGCLRLLEEHKLRFVHGSPAGVGSLLDFRPVRALTRAPWLEDAAVRDVTDGREQHMQLLCNQLHLLLKLARARVGNNLKSKLVHQQVEAGVTGRL